jgi:hypothetical protein
MIPVLDMIFGDQPGSIKGEKLDSPFFCEVSEISEEQKGDRQISKEQRSQMLLTNQLRSCSSAVKSYRSMINEALFYHSKGKIKSIIKELGYNHFIWQEPSFDMASEDREKFMSARREMVSSLFGELEKHIQEYDMSKQLDKIRSYTDSLEKLSQKSDF